MTIEKNEKNKKIEKINSNNAPKAIGPYSQAIATDNLIFVSGQIPINPKTSEFIGSTILEQTRQCLENIKAILAEKDLTLSNVVKSTVLLDNMNDFTEMNSIYAEYFSEPYPARACFEVAKLPLNALVEIEVIAVK